MVVMIRNGSSHAFITGGILSLYTTGLEKALVIIGHRGNGLYDSSSKSTWGQHSEYNSATDSHINN